jgi:predicted enzyme related to lactoylglutathione lyase
MNTGLQTIIVPVSDLERAKAHYSALLGVPPAQDESYYVGFALGDQHLGLDPNGAARGMTGPVGYWHVDDIDKMVQMLLVQGATVRSAVQEVGGGRRVAVLADTDGNPIGLLSDSD